MRRQYYVYLLTNFTNSVIYTGVTGDLKSRVHQHREGLTAGFTSKYRVWKLVYFEETADVHSALEREKQIKAGPRARKVALIMATNPTWRDLFHEI